MYEIKRGRNPDMISSDGLLITDILDEVAGVYPRVMHEGAIDSGAWACGLVAGLIHDLPTVDALIQRIMADADSIIRQRLEGMLKG